MVDLLNDPKVFLTGKRVIDSVVKCVEYAG
jgi:hypothetical protein